MNNDNIKVTYTNPAVTSGIVKYKYYIASLMGIASVVGMCVFALLIFAFSQNSFVVETVNQLDKFARNDFVSDEDTEFFRNVNNNKLSHLGVLVKEDDGNVLGTQEINNTLQVNATPVKNEEISQAYIDKLVMQSIQNAITTGWIGQGSSATSKVVDNSRTINNYYSAIGGEIGGVTPGSVLFADTLGNLSEDNDNLFYDSTNKRLGIGTNTPTAKISIADSSDTSINLNTIGVGSTLSSNFAFTGAPQTFVVPTGVTSITIEAEGAQGGVYNFSSSARGAYVKSTIDVTPGETIYVYVGGQGTPSNTTFPLTGGGWNGGGDGGVSGKAGQGGGGASDIRRGGQTLTDRILVAGGGGGQGGGYYYGTGGGGGGGYYGGGGGSAGGEGGGGTQSAGGVGGSVSTNGTTFGLGEDGSLGQGGDGWSRDLFAVDIYRGGCIGGNAGLVGNDGQRCQHDSGGGGGGGSSYVTGQNTQVISGYRIGNGKVTITYESNVVADVNWSFGADHSDKGNFKISGNSILGVNDYINISSTGNVGIGSPEPSARLHSTATTEQLRLGYDSQNYWSNTVNSSGDLTMQGYGIGGAITVNPKAGQNFNVNLAGYGNFAVNTNHLVVHSETGRVGIGTAGPAAQLHVTGIQPTGGAYTASQTLLVSGVTGGNSDVATTASGGIGSAITLNTGNGGQATAAAVSSTGGTAGTLTLQGGTGGAASVAGTGNNTGGAGSAFTFSAGTGGAASGVTSGNNTGGFGGAVNLAAGTGGAATAGSGNLQGGNGGAMTLSAGTAGAGATAGGTGGSLTLQGGASAASPSSGGGGVFINGRGGSVTGTGGNGGGIFITAGLAGGNNTVSRSGGTISITAGTSRGAFAGGAVNIAANAAGDNQTTAAVTASGAVGGGVTLTAGVGGIASLATTASTGGAGGTITLQGSLGGGASVAGTGNNTGGAGSALSLLAGGGGAANGVTSGINTGGTGGGISITAGTGGAATAGSGNLQGGTGGGLTLSAGTAGAGATAGGNGGTLTLQGGGAAVAPSSAGGGIVINGAAGSSNTTGGNGGVITLTAGAAGGNNTVSRTGGTVTLTAGVSRGASVGGAVNLTAAAAGDNQTTGATTATGAAGGGMTFTLGGGGIASLATVASTGGAAGTLTLQGGTGGAAFVAGTGNNTGGAGSAFTFSAGTGGAANGVTSGTNTGGAGGAITLQAGTGGAASAGSGTLQGGAGGVLSLLGGSAGSNNANGGSVFVAGGALTGTGTNGNVILGVTSVGVVRGNVGVGTNNPLTKLDVNGGATSVISTIRSDLATDSILRFYNNTNGGDFDIYRPNGTRDLYFYSFQQGTTLLSLKGATGNVGIGTASPSTKLEIGSSDLGNGAAGPVITLGRNTNATNTGAGSINFQSKAGTAGYVWQDAAGNMRINTAAPSNANDVAGTVIGTQSSTRNTKQNIADYNDYNAALLMVTNAPLHTFKYKKDVQGYGNNSDLAKTRIGFIADEVSEQFMWGNTIDQVSVNGILMGSVKALDQKITDLQAQVLALQGQQQAGQINIPSDTPLVLQSHLYLSEDSVGQARIDSGSNRVRVSFEVPYQYLPIVTATPVGVHQTFYGIENITANGFDVVISEVQINDITFNWHAFAGENAKLTVTSGAKYPITFGSTQETSNVISVVDNQDDDTQPDLAEDVTSGEQLVPDETNAPVENLGSIEESSEIIEGQAEQISEASSEESVVTSDQP